MPSISGLRSRSQLRLTVRIVHPRRREDLQAGRISALPRTPNLTALVDTGATRSMVSGYAARSAGLRPVTNVQVQGIFPDPQWHRAYLCYLAFTAAASSAATTGNVTLHVLNDLLQAAELPDGLDFDVIIGMDVIALGRLAIEANGTFNFTY